MIVKSDRKKKLRAVFAGDLHAILNPNCGQKQVLVIDKQHANSAKVYWIVLLDCLQILAIPIEEDLFVVARPEEGQALHHGIGSL